MGGGGGGGEGGGGEGEESKQSLENIRFVRPTEIFIHLCLPHRYRKRKGVRGGQKNPSSHWRMFVLYGPIEIFPYLCLPHRRRKRERGEAAEKSKQSLENVHFVRSD